MKNFIYIIIGSVCCFVMFDISAMSMERIMEYSSRYKSLAKVSTENNPGALTLAQSITLAKLQTTTQNIAAVGRFLEKGGNDERLRLLEYVVLYSLSLENEYRVSAEQIRLIGILRDSGYDKLLKQLKLYNSLRKYFACYNYRELALPSIPPEDKQKIEGILSKPIEIISEDIIVKEILSFIIEKRLGHN